MYSRGECQLALVFSLRQHYTIIFKQGLLHIFSVIVKCDSVKRLKSCSKLHDNVSNPIISHLYDWPSQKKDLTRDQFFFCATSFSKEPANDLT